MTLWTINTIKDVSLGISKSDQLGATVAPIIHVAAQLFLAVRNGLIHFSSHTQIKT